MEMTMNLWFNVLLNLDLGEFLCKMLTIHFQKIRKSVSYLCILWLRKFANC